MSTGSHPTSKKRQRDPEYDHEGPIKRRTPNLGNTRLQPHSAIYLKSESHHHSSSASNSVGQSALEPLHESQIDIQLLELPYEILESILTFLDQFGFEEPITSLEKQPFKRDTRGFHRRDIHAARITCTFFKSLTDQPSLWASHLLLRSNCLSFSGMSSMSPFRHDETSLKHITTLLIVVEDSLGSFRENKEFRQLLLSGACIEHLAIIRRTPASETFVRSSVISELTPVEHMVMHFPIAVPLITKLRRLTLTNVVIRPSLLKVLYSHAPTFSQLEISWVNVTLPSFERRKIPIKNESLLVSMDPKTLPNSAIPIATPSKSPTHAVVTAHISAEARLLLETDPGGEMAFSQLELSGGAALAFGKHHIHAGLQYLHIDFSTMAEQHEWERYQSSFALIGASCPSLVSFGVILGHLAKSARLEFGKVVLDLQTPYLTALYSDLSISVDLVPRLANWISSVPKLQILDLRFSPVRSNSTSGSTPSLKSETPDTNRMSPICPLVIPTARAAPFPGFSPMITSPNFMFNANSTSPLAGLFSNASTSISATPAAYNPTPSLMNALSEHCKRLVKLRLTSNDDTAVDEDWSLLQFPSLTYLKYNIGKLHNTACASFQTKFPRLSHLDLAHCEITEDAAFNGIEKGVGLKYLRVEDCNVNVIEAFMPFFESRDACARLVQVDLRVRRPHGIDAILLQRIAHSCPLLRRFAFSVSQTATSTSSSVSLRPFTILVTKCTSLRTVQCPDRSIFTPVINDLLMRHSVSIKQS